MSTEWITGAPREVYALVEEKLPFGIGRVLAPLSVLLLVLWLLALAVQGIYGIAVKPMGAWIAQRSGGVDQWTAFVGVMSLGFIGLLIAMILLFRHLRKWQATMFLTIENYLTPQMRHVTRRVEHLEQHAAGLEATNDAIGALYGRLIKLEPIPPSVQPHQLTQHLLMTQMSGPRVAPVGQIEGPKQ